MAVYTEVSDDELDAFVAQYDIGRIASCKGIAEGVENSNYLLHADDGAYILTLYEKRVARRDLPFFLGLMEHLAGHGIACPTPIKGATAWHCAAVRAAGGVSHLGLMARRRRRAVPALGRRARPHASPGSIFRCASRTVVGGGLCLFETTADRADEVRAGLAEELAAELAVIEARWPTALETGVIHADLFPDNVFFLGDRLSGVIDFYFACDDFLAYDLAICLNAWCFESDGSFNVTKARLMLTAYGKARPISAAEIDALPLFARGSALRFLLTRLYDWLNHPEGALVKPKDPLEYLHRLRFHAGVRGPGAYGLG
jgi:homoserine kinase type II